MIQCLRLKRFFVPEESVDSNVRLVRLFAVLLIAVYLLELVAIAVVSYELASRHVSVLRPQIGLAHHYFDFPFPQAERHIIAWAVAGLFVCIALVRWAIRWFAVAVSCLCIGTMPFCSLFH